MLTKLYSPPISVGAGAVYPYNPNIIEACERTAKYDEGKFSLCTVVGDQFAKRIWVPRNMAPSIPVDNRVAGLSCTFKSIFKPRNDEQTRCISECVARLRKGESFIFQAPTGMGKTWCSADIIAKIGKKTLIIVTKEDILDQWVAAFEAILGLKLGVDIGVIKGDKCDVAGRSVVIAMVQSIAKDGRYPENTFRDFGLMVCDEVHRMGADFFSQACFQVPALLRLGISATPKRKDGREEVLEAHIGPVSVRSVIPPMVPRIIRQESPWCVPQKRKLNAMGQVVMDEWGEIQMTQIPHSPGKCGHIINMICEHHGRNKLITNFVSQSYKAGRKIIVQSDRKEHLVTLMSLASSQGVPQYHMTMYVGGLNKAQREEAKEGMVIFGTYQMMAEATDIPDADTLVMGSPKSDVEQIVGRVLRFVPDKKEPVVFDLVDSTSSVMAGYAANRMRWYASMGINVKKVG